MCTGGPLSYWTGFKCKRCAIAVASAGLCAVAGAVPVVPSLVAFLVSFVAEGGGREFVVQTLLRFVTYTRLVDFRRCERALRFVIGYGGF